MNTLIKLINCKGQIEKLKKISNYGLKFSVFTIFFISCDCEFDPDLIVKLSAPTSDIIAGEDVDWRYVIESTKEGAKQTDGSNCKIIDAIASIGLILIEFFDDPSSSGDQILYKENNVPKLEEGKSSIITNKITNAFVKGGVYILETEADVKDDVVERNELNNVETNFQFRSNFDLFPNASNQFKEKLSRATAIVIVGNDYDYLKENKSVYGIPIYFAK